MTPDPQELRRDLAAAFRGAAAFAGQAGVCNHFSLRVGGEPPRFLVNPWGSLFSDMHASDLLVVDVDGQVIEGDGDAGPAAFNIHAAVHRRGDAACVMHTHMPYVTALSMIQGGRLEPSSQEALRFHGAVAYDDEYNGLAHDTDEGERIAGALGQASVLILAHHGVIVVGRSVAQAYDRLYYIERAAQLQVLAMSTGRPLRHVPEALARHTFAQFNRDIGIKGRDWHQLHLDALRRKLDREQPDYAA